jgi:hypothetical protein
MKLISILSIQWQQNQKKNYSDFFFHWLHLFLIFHSTRISRLFAKLIHQKVGERSEKQFFIGWGNITKIIGFFQMVFFVMQTESFPCCGFHQSSEFVMIINEIKREKHFHVEKFNVNLQKDVRIFLFIFTNSFTRRRKIP